MTDSQYFAEKPSVASKPSVVRLILPDLSADLAVDQGVFSAQRVDAGTKLLLLEAGRALDGAKTLLDLGCGYGPIAVTLAHRHADATVWAVDTNERARNLTKQNLSTVPNPQRCHVGGPDDVPPDMTFDYIASNPPIRIGKPALHLLLTTWLDRLNPGGVADLVVQKHLGSDSLAAWMTDQGWQTTRTLSRASYRILRVEAKQ